MKNLFYTSLVYILSIFPSFAETQKVSVGNPDSQNIIEINQFYVISPNNDIDKNKDTEYSTFEEDEDIKNENSNMSSEEDENNEN